MMMDQSYPQCPPDMNTSSRKDGHEVIEVQMLPQDDVWGDNVTAITANTSERSNSPIGNSTKDANIKWATMKQEEESAPSLGWCQRYIGSAVGAVVVLIAAASPVIMVVGHRIGFPSGRPVTTVRECGPECHALLLALTVKLVALFGAIWAIFWRPSPATMPRIYFFRAITLLLAFIAAFTFWLFYWVRAEEDGELSMVGATAFAGGLADALLALHYLGVLLTEIRHISPQFQISVVRSPDGVSKQWTIGGLSIQRTAVWVLQHYYCEFPSYNPHLDRLPPLRKRRPSIGNGNAPSFKFYDLDGISSSFTPAGRLSRHGGISHNERYYEEHEFERRVRKRRARLIAATEEAFTHIKRIQDEQGSAVPLDSMEAAAAVFPSLARPLQKYLRVTRQQPWHSAESVLNHLAICLRLGLAPRAFLDRYLSYQPVLQANTEGSISSWALVSDFSVSRTIAHDMKFLLRNADVSLLVSVTALPHFNVTEQVVDPKSNKFTLRLNSETSV
jgi:vang-like